jgi:hypothetical protein
MGLIPSEPITKVVEISKIFAKFSVEDATIHPTGPAHRPGEKGEKNKNKNIAMFF